MMKQCFIAGLLSVFVMLPTGCHLSIEEILTPLPDNALPSDQIIEGGLQLHITEQGFERFSMLAQGVMQDLIRGVCIEPTTQNLADIGEVTVCNKMTSRCALGCYIDGDVSSVNIGTPEDSTLAINIDFSLDEVLVPLSAEFLGFQISCTPQISLIDNSVQVLIDMNINQSDGSLSVAVGEIKEVSFGEISIVLPETDCDFSFLSDVLEGFFNTFIRDNIGFLTEGLFLDLINSLLAEAVPDPLGLASSIDVSAIISEIGSSVDAKLETWLVPGGHLSFDQGAMSLGIMTGLNSDSTPETRTPRTDSDPALCVPSGLTAPVMTAPPFSLPQSTRCMNGQCRVTTELATDIITNAEARERDLGFGISESFLDLLGYHMIGSGTMCLGVDGTLVRELNIETLSLVIPELSEIGANPDDPIAVFLRPQRPIDFTIGEGIDTDPQINMAVEDLEVDIYALVFERYVRVLTITASVNLGLNLDFAEDSEGVITLQPVVIGVNDENITMRASNAEFLGIDEAVLDDTLGAFVEFLGPLLSGFVTGIPLPTIAGFSIDEVEIGKTQSLHDDFLALYMTLKPSEAMNRWLPEAYREVASIPVETRASLVSTTVPTAEIIREALKTKTKKDYPAVIIELDAHNDDRNIEWSWRLNHGFWHPYSSATTIHIQNSALTLQGKHHIEIRGRVHGDIGSVDRTPVTIPVWIDSVAPQITSIDQSDDMISVSVHDITFPDNTIEIAYGVSSQDKPLTSWSTERTISLSVAQMIASEGALRVFARDGQKNMNHHDIVLTHGVLTQMETPSVGCSTSDGQSSLIGLLVVLMGLMILRHRRFAVTSVLLCLLMMGSACDGCSSDSEPSSDGDKVEDPMVSDPTVIDVPLGIVGEYTSMVVDSLGFSWIAAYNSDYGDLMVAKTNKRGRVSDDLWTFVDGVPTENTSSSPTTGYRDGIIDPGDDVGLYTSIAVGPSNEPMVSYHDRTTGSLKIAIKSGDSWDSYPVDIGEPISFTEGAEENPWHVIGLFSSLIRDESTGQPGIAYMSVQFYPAQNRMITQLRFAQATVDTPLSRNQWTIFLVDEEEYVLDDTESATVSFARGTGLFVSADRDPEGNPVLAYYESTNGTLKLAWFNSAAGTFDAPITIEGSSEEHNNVGWYPSLHVDSDSIAHISYVNTNRTHLRYIQFNGVDNRQPSMVVDDGYRIDGVNAFGEDRPVFHLMGYDNALLINQNHRAIAYQDATTHDLVFAIFEDDRWTTSILSGDSAVFQGAYGFFISGALVGDDAIIANWVVNEPEQDFYVEIVRFNVNRGSVN